MKEIAAEEPGLFESGSCFLLLLLMLMFPHQSFFSLLLVLFFIWTHPPQVTSPTPDPESGETNSSSIIPASEQKKLKMKRR